MAAPAVIEFEGVGLAYAAHSGAPTIALDDLRCRFLPGKVTAIIGPSGCGKSTMLQIARGFLDPTAGRLRFVALLPSATKRSRRCRRCGRRSIFFRGSP